MFNDKVSFHLYKVVLIHVLEKKEVYHKDLGFMQKGTQYQQDGRKWLGTFYLGGLRLGNLGESLGEKGMT